jgi:glyoxylase-like metal-dependent hydrolase (beta-lactamase superfamily II)
MLAVQPELTTDVGFQLSFLGTAAIVLLTPSLEHRLRWAPRWLREPFAVTCAAQVGTAPIMATGFGVVSPSAPLSNAAVLPLLPALVAGGLLITPLAAVPAVGRVAAVPLAALLKYLEQVAGVLARLPAAAIPVPGFPTWAGAVYYVGAGAMLASARLHGPARRGALLVGVLGPLLVTIGEVEAWVHQPPSATALQVGGGQAVLLRGPSGTVLIDGGPSAPSLEAALGRHLPPWDRRLAAVVVTGPGVGHVGGLRGLPYQVGEVVVADRSLVAGALRDTVLTLVGRGAQLVKLQAGLVAQVAGLALEALAPEPGATDPGQLAVRVRGPSRTFCDLADLDADHQEDAAARLPGPCDAVVVPGQGRSVPVPDLLRRARAQQLVVCDAAGGRLARGFPPGSVVRTSQEGDVLVPL